MSHGSIWLFGSNNSILLQARSKVSWTRSSARSTLHSDTANARRSGIAATMALQMEGSRSTAEFVNVLSRPRHAGLLVVYSQDVVTLQRAFRASAEPDRACSAARADRNRRGL